MTCLASQTNPRVDTRLNRGLAREPHFLDRSLHIGLRNDSEHSHHMAYCDILDTTYTCGKYVTTVVETVLYGLTGPRDWLNVLSHCLGTVDDRIFVYFALLHWLALAS